MTVVGDSTKHGVRIRYANLIKTAAKALQGEYLISENDEKAHDVFIFLDVFKHYWKSLFKLSEDAVKKRREETMRRPARLPDVNHLCLLKQYMVGTLENFDFSGMSPANYIKLRKFTLTRLIFFNGRRVNEPGRMTIKEMEDAFEGVWINTSALNKLSKEEQVYVLSNFHISYISAKNNATVVDILIPKELTSYIKFLAFLSRRRVSGNRSSLKIDLITEDPKIRKLYCIEKSITNNRNTGNKSLYNCTKI